MKTNNTFYFVLLSSLFLINCISYRYSNVSKGSENYNYSMSEKVSYDKSTRKFEKREGFKGNVYSLGTVKIQRLNGQLTEEKTDNCFEGSGRELDLSKKFEKIYSIYIEDNSFCVIYD